MALEDKSIHQLRAIAEGIGLPVDFSLDKTELLAKIRDAARPAAGFPTETSIPDPAPLSGSLDTCLSWLTRQGLIVSLDHAENTIRMTRRVGDIIKDDSCSLTAPLRVIMQCGAKLLEN